MEALQNDVAVVVPARHARLNNPQRLHGYARASESLLGHALTVDDCNVQINNLGKPEKSHGYAKRLQRAQTVCSISHYMRKRLQQATVPAVAAGGH